MQTKSPWLWVPSLYFSQGIPFMVVTWMTTVMYKNLGMSNAELAFYTSWLYIPWVIKPLWSPFVDMFRTKRFFVVGMQLLVGVAFASIAFTASLPNFIEISLAIFWLVAFSSATHDIAADGFYMLGLPQKQQAAFVGIRSTSFRLAMIFVQGGLVYIAGQAARYYGDVRLGWAIVFVILALIFFAMFFYHQFILPRPDTDRAIPGGGDRVKDFFNTFRSFFAKPGILLILGFLLTYRLGEAQLLKLVAPFLLDPMAEGGLGLSNEELAFAYGTVGVIAMLAGGLLGGWVISRIGLKKALWPMVFSIHVPDLVFVFLAATQPDNLATVAAFIALEQFGYGFGFAAYLLYMIMVSEGEQKTSHYAICTGIMALGMMLPGMASGWIQEQLGYLNFFIYVVVATIPAFIMAAIVKIDPEFGKK